MFCSGLGGRQSASAELFRPKRTLATGAAGRVSQQEPSRKTRNLLERDGCRSFRSALASIWRMRSRVSQMDQTADLLVLFLKDDWQSFLPVQFKSLAGIDRLRSRPLFSS